MFGLNNSRKRMGAKNHVKNGAKTAVFIVLAAWNINSFAQVEQVIHVVKSDTIVFQSLVFDMDNITFDDVTLGEALIVYKKDNSSADTTMLSDIQQISFREDNMSIEMLNDNKIYAFEDIAKLLFGDIGTTGINNPSMQNSFDILVYVAPTGNVVVESPITIKSLKLFSIDGKMISMQDYKDLEKQCIVSLRDNAAGVYLLQVETEQGTIVKKVIKPLNK
jgi:hypothetical protein